MVTTNESMLPAALHMFLDSLPKFSPEGGERKFYVNKVAHDPSIAFSIAEKMPPGQMHNGSRIRIWGGLTYRQCNQIERTSENVEEIVERFRAHIFEGIDTTRSAHRAGAVSPLDQQREIEARVKAILDEKLEALIDERLQKRAVDTMPKGLQQKTIIPAKEAATHIDAEWELWRGRAAEMGINEPIGRSRDRHIDGRWLRSAKKLWDDYKDGKDVSGKVLVIGKDGATAAKIEDTKAQ